MLRAGTVLQDRYEILEKIGSGGMSDVYRAKCHKLDRMVAIKVLKEEFCSDASFVEKFKMEAQAAARLSHPSIVNVYDVVDEGDFHYIVMELVEGITLKSYILKKGVLGVKEAIGIALQVAQGIEAAHENGIVHRDIKPQNIIISMDGTVKVADFGIARAASSHTMSATAVGSVHYISPEQARGGYCDARSDIYSFGVTMYEMVTGRVPFEGDNTVTVALAHLETPIEPPSAVNPAVPVSLEKIILKCTEKKPEYRYASMGEVISDLRRALIEPDEDFVEEISKEDNTAKTRKISEEELSQIRQGRTRKEAQTAGTESSEQQEALSSGDSQKEEPEIGRQVVPPKEAEEPEEKQPGRPKKKNGGPQVPEDVNPQLEKLLTGLGILVAGLFVVGVLVVLIRISGIFNLGTRENPTQAAETSSAAAVEDDTTTIMPRVVGYTMDEAEEILKEHDLTPTWEEVYDDTAEKGVVISQEKAEGENVERYSKVKLTASLGSDQFDLAAYGIFEMTEEEAKDFFAKNHITASFQRQYDETVEAGRIISCTPQTVKAGDTVTVVVSDGQEQAMTVVPNLLDQTEENALQLLADAGLEPGKVTFDNSSDIEKGSVMGQEVPSGTAILRGSLVGYTVSAGPSRESSRRYVGAINDTFDPRYLIGPGSGSVELRILIRLKQVVDGTPQYTPLMPATVISGSTLVPVSFSNIEGAEGVSTGEVEIVNADTQEVLKSYTVQFFPLG